MASSAVIRETRSGEPVGQIFTSLILTNSADLDNADSGLISPAAIRSVELDNVLVDTGATYLCLPIDVIKRLGLRPARTVRLETASGEVETRIFRNVQLSLLGRVTISQCVELPAGSRPLLGAIPLEGMGIEPELSTRTLRLLPDSGPYGYLTA
jgi:predicted aspartyl protease